MLRLIPVQSLSILMAAMLVFAGASAASADDHDTTEAEIKYRQSVMSIIGTHMGAVGDILKNRLVVPGAIEKHAQQMAASAALIGPAFKNRLPEGETDAEPAIWEDWAKFEKGIARYQEAANNLASAAGGNDPAAVGQAVRALGKSCGGCHKPFKKPKEESYKTKN